MHEIYNSAVQEFSTWADGPTVLVVPNEMNDDYEVLTLWEPRIHPEYHHSFFTIAEVQVLANTLLKAHQWIKDHPFEEVL